MFKNKIFAASSLVAFVALGTTLVSNPVSKERNLKVLPQDISDAKLDSIMDSYNKALGVKCGFCHVRVQGFTDSLDFASDNNQHKEKARDMMRMTIDINKKYFPYQPGERPEYLNTITCITCHRGQEFPPE